MPVVTIKMLEGRTVEQKRQLAEVITKIMVDIANAKPEGTTVIIEDYPKHNWAMGGKLMSER